MTLHLDEGVEPLPGYRIVRKLGQGGFGEVWEAEAPGGVHIALKFIRLNTSACEPELRALEIIRNIRHPHLLDIQFTVKSDEHLILATPLCDESLWDRFCHYRSRGKTGLPPGELLENMEEVAKAIDFLNEPRHLGPGGARIGIQHRDIKPHNIFLVGGCARLADFGLAKVLEKSQCSHTGSMTPSYMAPEVLQGIVTSFSDQYSLAVTYCQLRSGQLPFCGDMGRVMYGHIHEPPDLSLLPPNERPIVSRALAKKPEERWPNCLIFVKRLREMTPVDLDDSPRYQGETRPPQFAMGSYLTTEESTHSRGWPVPPSPAAPVVPGPASDSEGPQGSESDPARPRGKKGSLTVLGIVFTLLLMVTYGQTSLQPPQDQRQVTPPRRSDKNSVADRPVGFRIGPASPAGNKGIESTKPEPFVARIEGFVNLHPAVPPEEMAKATLQARPRRGVLPPPPRVRLFRGEKDILTAIGEDLEKTAKPYRPFQRYFSITNLHNDFVNTTSVDLRAARSALAEVMKRLSRKPGFAGPVPIDADETVLKFDLRDLGWEGPQGLWKGILGDYPYGVKYDQDEDRAIRELAQEVYEQAETEQPCIRADWFVWYVATEAPHPIRDVLIGHPGQMHDPGQGDRQELKVGTRGLPRYVGVLVEHYRRKLGPSDVACELGIADVNTLVKKIQGDPRIRSHRLKTLAEGGQLEREAWQRVFVDAIDYLDLGVYVESH